MPYLGYISGNSANWESRFHQYTLNSGDGTGAGSPFASYIAEADSYRSSISSGIFNKWNREYQHKLFAYTHNYHYLFNNIT